MSTQGNENTEAETGIIEGSEENSVTLSSELVDIRVKPSLEPLHAQIFALTVMIDRLIQSNLTILRRRVPEGRDSNTQYGSFYSEGLESSKFPTVAPLTTAGYSPDRGIKKYCLFPQLF